MHRATCATIAAELVRGWHRRIDELRATAHRYPGDHEGNAAKERADELHEAIRDVLVFFPHARESSQ
jgi:hypothetical protein